MINTRLIGSQLPVIHSNPVFLQRFSETTII